jgi:hypothetical protein
MDAALLHAWSGHLCRIGGGTAEVVAALGLAPVPAGTDGYVVVERPPPGTGNFLLRLLGGTVDAVMFRFVGGRVTGADLRARFGVGEWEMAMPPHIPYHRMTYRVEVPGAPFACAVSAAFEEYPEDRSRVVEVSMQRHRVYRPGEPRPGMDVLADLVRDWSRLLCRLPKGEPAEAAAALGLTGSLVPSGSDAYRIVPALPGTREVGLSMRDGGVAYVRLHLLDSTVTRADLDARLGSGGPGVRIHPFERHPLLYSVTVPDAPYTCLVIARFDVDPAPATVVEEVTLRRDARAP